MKSSALIFAKIKRTVRDHEPGAAVLLFGSQARGDADQFSDYDLLIITQIEYSPAEKNKKSSELNKLLVKNIDRPVDVIFTSEKELAEKRQLPGHLFRTAAREGILL